MGVIGKRNGASMDPFHLFDFDWHLVAKHAIHLLFAYLLALPIG